MKSFYINDKGESVPKADATQKRYRCDCGQHGWDVLLSDVRKDTDARIQAYADSLHGEEIDKPS